MKWACVRVKVRVRVREWVRVRVRVRVSGLDEHLEELVPVERPRRIAHHRLCGRARRAERRRRAFSKSVSQRVSE